MCWIEASSFLPNRQNNRRNLPGYGQTSHRGLHPRGQQSGIKLSERPSRGTRARGRALEYFLQLVVVVLVEAAQCRRSLGALQLAAGDTIRVAALVSITDSIPTFPPESITASEIVA